MRPVLFKDPYFLLLLGFIPLLVLPKRRPQALPFPAFGCLKGAGGSWRTRLIKLPVLLRIGALVLFVLALANPVRTLRTIRYGEGLDVILAIDVSTSMLAEDFTVGTSARTAWRW